MAIRFYCPLGHRLHAPASQQGKLVHCPACRQRVIVPLLDLGSREPAGSLTSPAPKNSVGQVFSGSVDPKLFGDQKRSSAFLGTGPSPSGELSETAAWTGFLPSPPFPSTPEEWETDKSPAALSPDLLASAPNAQGPPTLPEKPVLPGPEEPVVELVSLASEGEDSALWPARGDEFPPSEKNRGLPGVHFHPPPPQQGQPVEQPGCLEDIFLAEEVLPIPPESVFWETVFEDIEASVSAQAERLSAPLPPPVETSATSSPNNVSGSPSMFPRPGETSASASSSEVHERGSPADRPTAEVLSDEEILGGRSSLQPDGVARQQSARRPGGRTDHQEAVAQESALTRPVEEVPPVPRSTTSHPGERSTLRGEKVLPGPSRPASDTPPARPQERKLAPAQHGELPREAPAQTALPAHSSVDRVGGQPGAAPALWPPPKPVDGDPVRSHEVRWLGVWLGLIVLFSIGPAFRHLVLSTAPGWARLVVLLGLWELAYVAWMVLSVHRSALWVVMVVFAAGATLSAVTTAFTLVAAKDGMLPVGLDQIRRWAPSWFGCVLAVQTLGAYLAGRLAFWWGEMDRRLARHQRLG
jgi:hypothetical protein